MTKDFKDYFTGKPVIPTGQRIDTDELLVLRGGIVHRSNALRVQGAAGMSDNAAVTTINVIDDWEPIGGVLAEVFSSSDLSFGANAFTFNGDNQLTYSIISGHASIDKSTNGAASVQLGIFVNGVLSGIPFTASIADNTQPAYMQALTGVQLQNGDVVDLRVRNRTDTDDLIVLDAGLIIQ
jgi:hypothetical protein